MAIDVDALRDTVLRAQQKESARKAREDAAEAAAEERRLEKARKAAARDQRMWERWIKHVAKHGKTQLIPHEDGIFQYGALYTVRLLTACLIIFLSAVELIVGVPWFLLGVLTLPWTMRTDLSLFLGGSSLLTVGILGFALGYFLHPVRRYSKATGAVGIAYVHELQRRLGPHFQVTQVTYRYPGEGFDSAAIGMAISWAAK